MSSYTLHIQYVDRPAETRTFTQPKVTLGRDAGDIVLHDTQVSGRHGEISFDGSTLRYTDVGSTNGSFLLQGQRIANIELTPGIALRLGNSLITVQVIDAPNVAGKGRTVIAGPGMAPGFPAPMRPAPPAAPAGPIPRPGMPPAPPPGGFAHAPTAHMQSPGLPGMPGMPAPSVAPAPPSGSFVPQPATTSVSPAAPSYPTAPAPMAPPASPPPQAVVARPGFATQPPQTLLPPMSAPAVPGMPPASSFPDVPPASLAVAGPADDLAVLRSTKPDLVTAVKGALLGGWSVVAPTASVTIGVFLALMVPISVLIWLFAMILPGAAFALGSLLGVAQAVAMVVLIPSAYRYLLAAHLGQPIAPQAALAEVRAKLGEVFVNMLIPGIVLGVFAGPIYWLENKKLGDAIRRNFNLIGRDVVTVIVTLVALSLSVGLLAFAFAMGLAYLGNLGLLLGLLVGDVLNAVLTVYILGLSTWFYFDIRRRFESADPEGEAGARLAAPALPPP